MTKTLTDWQDDGFYDYLEGKGCPLDQTQKSVTMTSEYAAYSKGQKEARGYRQSMERNDG
jgi:hypothetical protein